VLELGISNILTSKKTIWVSYNRLWLFKCIKSDPESLCVLLEILSSKCMRQRAGCRMKIMSRKQQNCVTDWTSCGRKMSRSKGN